MSLRGLTWDHPRGYAVLDRLGGMTWNRQPLEDFESRPLSELVNDYDLIVIDHPGLGDAIAADSLQPLDNLFDADELAGYRDATVGASFGSYTVDGRQWALPLDAAAQVAVATVRMAERPRTWGAALAAAARHNTTLCLGGPHALLMYEAIGIALRDPLAALGVMARLLAHADRELSQHNPIAILDAMSSPGGPEYCPLVFGYVTYRQLDAFDAPSGPGGIGSVLGGTGVAVTRSCTDLDAARAQLRRLVSPAVQIDGYAEWGGQSSLRAAWQVGGFYRGTVATVEAAWVRPRYAGYIEFQSRASAAIREGLLEQAPHRHILERIERISA